MPPLHPLIGAFSILCLVVSAPASQAEADIYRWVSPEGILSFGQSPPRDDLRDLTRLNDTVAGTATATEESDRSESFAATSAPLTAVATVPEVVPDDFQETMREEEPLPVFTLSAVALPRLFLSEADFQELSETGVSPLAADEPPVILTAISLNEVSLAGTDLSAVSLPGASLTGAYLSEADLEATWLPRAVLFGASLAGANLQGVNLQEANLQGADLRAANLRGANLRGASLLGANLQDAVLDEADLRGADLTNVIGLTGGQLALAAIDDTTQLPEEF
jgi:uncharacterized protein YjbI with pentapeptide repeats